MPSPAPPPESLLSTIKQSPPLDLSTSYSPTWVKGKTILITGGASGFGAAFVRHWAQHGATIIIGDINIEGGTNLARDVTKETGNKNVHFVHCDVTDWQSQVSFFKEGVRLSPHGGIDTVVANAGIAGRDPLQHPRDIDTAEPRKPNFKIVDVNATGVLYTTHLAYWYLPRNPGSSPANINASPSDTNPRDRHLLLLGSIASIAPIAIQPQYGFSKHAVLGLFRSLRATSSLQGVRINIVLPYFIDTPIVTPFARVALAGGSLGKVEDVVDAATRFVADSRILGRGLVVGPKVSVKQNEEGGWELVGKGEQGAVERAAWEPCVDDWEETDQFNRFVVKVLNGVQTSRGWIGWAGDILWIVGRRVGLVR